MLSQNGNINFTYIANRVSMFVYFMILTIFSICFSRPKLPEYLLDFGHVVLGTVRTHVVRATNTGHFAATFQVEHDDFHHFGFHVDLDRVKNLPGYPDNETVDFVVSFDPRGANLQLGPVEKLVPINVIISSVKFVP